MMSMKQLLKHQILLVIMLFLMHTKIINGKHYEPTTESDRRPVLLKSLIQRGNKDLLSENEMNSDENEHRFNVMHRNHNDNDYEEDNKDEIMKTSEQIAFRPLFRHKQMMEERKKRKELRRRNSAEENESTNSNQRKFSSSNYFNNRYYDNDIYICYGQNCRPITPYDITRLQLLQPTTKFYRQRTEPGSYYNEFSFRRTRK